MMRIAKLHEAARACSCRSAVGALMLALLSITVAPTEAVVRVTTDGSSSRPHCSWSHYCDWDTEAKERCAEKVCKASGYATGDFVSEYNDMCSSGVSDRWQSYYLTDMYMYFWGKAKQEARIIADCHNNEVTTTTEPTTTTTETTVTQTTTSTTRTSTSTTVTSTSTVTTKTATSTTATTTTTTISTTTTTSVTETETETSTTLTTTSTTVTATSTTITETTTTETTTVTSTTTATVTSTTVTTTSTRTTTTFPTSGGGGGGFTFKTITVTTTTTRSTAPSGFEFIPATTTTQTKTTTTQTQTSSTSTVTTSTQTSSTSTVTTITVTSTTVTSSTTLTQTTTTRTLTSTSTVTSTRTSTTLTATETTTTRTTTSTRTTQTTTTTRTSTTSTTITSTSTQTGTTITTTSTSTTTLAQYCASVPEVENAADLTDCAGLETGASCEVECNEGYEMSGSLTCEHGSWVNSGECLATGTETTKVSALKMFVRLVSLLFSSTAAVTGSNIEAGVTSNYFGRTWAKGNSGLIRRAVARSLRRSSSLCKVGVHSGRSRRRLEDSNSTDDDDDDTDFELEVTVMVDSEEADSELANNMLGQLLDGSSDDDDEGGNLVSALTAQLEEEDVEAPEGLSSVESSSSGPVAVVEDYITEYSSWTTSDWGSCNALCGEGERNRTVSCEGGLDTLCDASAKPSETMVCEDYTQCEFQISCPLGEDSMNCTMQAGAFGIVLVLGAGVLCGAAIRCVRQRQLKRRLTIEEHGGIVKGAYIVQSKGSCSDLQSAFRVYRPQPESMEPRTSVGSDGNFTGAELEEGNKAKDGKTHVVWDVETRKLQEWFAEQGTDFQMTKTGSSNAFQMTKTGSSNTGMPRLAAASRSTNAMTGMASARTGRSYASASNGRDVTGVISSYTATTGAWEDEVTDDLDLESGVNTLAKDEFRGRAVGPSQQTDPSSTRYFVEQGSKVEYFSRNLGKWVPAITHLTEQASGVRYDVGLTCGGQQRLKVDLDCIRKPLTAGEPVEMNTASDGWQPAVVLGGNCTIGYSVQLKGETNAPPMDNVAAHLLRRRFSQGEVVWAFCKGEWVRGQIVEFAAEDMAFEAEACTFPDEESDFQDFVSPRQRPSTSPSESVVEAAIASASTFRSACIRLARPPQAMAPKVSGDDLEVVATYNLRPFVRSAIA